MDKYNNNGIRVLKCPYGGKKYLGQTGRPFRTRFKERLLSYKQQNRNSKFSQHLEYHHSIGPIEQIMDVVQVVNKGTFMNVLEKFCIYEETYKKNQLSCKSTVSYNRIFETIVKHASERYAPSTSTPSYNTL
jgi:hypothetical protein